MDEKVKSNLQKLEKIIEEDLSNKNIKMFLVGGEINMAKLGLDDSSYMDLGDEIEIKNVANLFDALYNDTIKNGTVAVLVYKGTQKEGEVSISIGKGSAEIFMYDYIGGKEQIPCYKDGAKVNIKECSSDCERKQDGICLLYFAKERGLDYTLS